MALPTPQPASNAMSISLQPPTTTTPTIFQAKLSKPETLRVRIGEDASAGDVQIPLPQHAEVLSEWEMPLTTQRVAVEALRQTIAAPVNEKYSFAVFTWNGEGMPSAKLSDAVHTKLTTKPLNRNPIEKRIWTSHKTELRRHRWRWVSMRMFRASDFSAQDLIRWEAGVQSHLRAENVVSLQNSYKLDRLQVEVSLTPTTQQGVGAADKPSQVGHRLAVRDTQIVSQAATTAQLQKRRNAGFVGNLLFDMTASSTVIDKGLALCFGSRHIPGAAPRYVGKLFFAPGSVADFLIARFGEARFLGIDGPPQKLMDNVRDCLRGVHIAVLDDLGCETSCVIVADDANVGIALDFPVARNGEPPLVHPRLPHFNIGTKYRPQWRASERCIILPLQPYTSNRPNKVDWMQQTLLLGRALGKIRLDLPAPVEQSDSAVARRDLRFKPASIKRAAHIGGPLMIKLAKPPTYVVLRVTSDISGEMKWPSIVFATLSRNLTEKAGLLTLKAEQIIDDAGHWQDTLYGFVVKHEKQLTDKDQVILVICLPSDLSEKSSKSSQYIALKTFCDIDLGIQSFVINESTLSGGHGDFLRGMDARVKRAADHIPARMKQRQQHVFAPRKAMSQLDEPLDLAVGIHITNLKPSACKDDTDVLVAITTRDVSSSRTYSTLVKMYSMADADQNFVSQQLANHLQTLLSEQSGSSRRQRVTIFRSGAWLEEARDEFVALGLTVDKWSQKVNVFWVGVSDDSAYSGQAYAQAAVVARKAVVASDLDAASSGLFHITGEALEEDSYVPALHVSQSQCMPNLKFVKLQLAGEAFNHYKSAMTSSAGAGAELMNRTLNHIFDNRAEQYPPTEGSDTLAPSASGDTIDHLAKMWVDDALGLYTCKWPIPTHLARCASKRALLHLKASTPDGTISANVSPTRSEFSVKSDDRDTTLSQGSDVTAVAKSHSVTTNVGSSPATARPLVFRSVHQNLQDTLYYL
nr:hypothetical protein B0A51_05483 [Rachicladosporium sp. CCFEE 5018]